MDGFLGEIRLFSFPKVPVGWAKCDGSLLQIAQNQALYSLLGIAFGGDGKTTFGLPDLRGRVPVQMGGVSNYTIGASGGVDTIALVQTQLPIHSHAVYCDNAAATAVGPSGNIPAQPAKVNPADPDAPPIYAPANSQPLTTLDPSIVSVAGAGAAHENRQPFVAINYCICTQGIYPQRP